MRILAASMFILAASACSPAPEAAAAPSPVPMAEVARPELAPAPTTPVPPPGPIPNAYRKTWAVNTADCASVNGATRISIDPATISFKGGRFDVVNFEENGSEELLMQVNRVAGGPVSKETHILHLNDSDTLSYQRGAITQLYHRCT